jgi:DNA-cytosine methyltransferase
MAVTPKITLRPLWYTRHSWSAQLNSLNQVNKLSTFAAARSESLADMEPENHLTPVISLFSGAGILDYAIEITDRVRIVATIEMDRTFAETLELNAAKRSLPSSRVICSDVREVDPTRLFDEAALKGKRFGIVGGPPCQSFSSMGRKGGVQDERGMLMFDFAKWVRALLPEFFLIENVPNFEKIENGKPFDALRRDLEQCGYSVTHAVLNAAD